MEEPGCSSKNSEVSDSKFEQAFESFSNIYSNMAEKIKNEDFQEILDIVKTENISFNVDSIRSIFVERLEEVLKKVCDIRDIKQKLIVINLLEKEYQNKEIIKWHPHGKDVKEQTRHLRIAMLNKKKNFMFKLLENQETKLEETVMKVEQNRQRIKELELKRAESSQMLDQKTQELKNIQDEYAKLKLRLNSTNH